MIDVDMDLEGQIASYKEEAFIINEHPEGLNFEELCMKFEPSHMGQGENVGYYVNSDEYLAMACETQDEIVSPSSSLSELNAITLGEYSSLIENGGTELAMLEGNGPVINQRFEILNKPFWKDPSSTCIHHARLGEHTVQLWIKSHMTDIVVRVKGRCFLAHKAVLTCYCPFFQKNILAPGRLDVQDVELQNVNPDAFEILLSYMYTGRLQLTCNNLGDVFRASRLLQMKDITHICAQILSGKIGGVVSALYLFVTAKKLNIPHACARSYRVITSRFMEISESIEFLHLDIDYLCEVLTANVIGTHSEIPIYMAALKWLDYDFFTREEHMVRVISCIRFTLMTLEELLTCFHPPLLPAIMEYKNVADIILRAVCYVSSLMMKKEASFRRMSEPFRHYLLEGDTMLWDDSKYDPFYFSSHDVTVAATKIQSYYRAAKSRNEFIDMKNKLDLAATKIQSFFKGFRVRKLIDNDMNSPEQFGLDPNSITLITNPSSLMLCESPDWLDFPKRNVPRNAFQIERSPDVSLILTIGGVNPFKGEDSSSGANVMAYNAEKNLWQNVSKLPAPRQYHCVIYHNNIIYIIGGCDPRDTINGDLMPTKSCLSYNLTTNKWCRMSDMCKGRIYHGTSILNNKIYAVGGKDEYGNMLDSIEVYNTEDDTWTDLTPALTCPRMGMSVISHDAMLWIIGGIMKSNINDRILVIREVDCFDPDTNTWIRNKEKIPNPRSFATSVMYDDMLYLIGGTTLNLVKSAAQLVSATEMFIYDFRQDQWMTGPIIPKPCHSSTSVYLNNCIYIMGGIITQEGIALDDVQCFDLDAKSWTECAPLPTAVSGIAAIILPKLE